MPDTLSALAQPISRRRFLRITAATGALALTGGVLSPLLRGANPSAYTATRTLMGTRIHLTLVAEDNNHARSAIETTFGAMARLVAYFDHRQPASLLARLNHNGYLDEAPAELIDLLTRAVTYGELTDGAFDVTVKPLLDIRQAASTDLPAVHALVDYRQIDIAGRRIRLSRPGAAMTLDGIAKGRVIDGGVEALQQLGFAHVLVEAGGDLRTLGARADGTPWRVGIAHPRPTTQGEILARLPVMAQAVATSGDYMNTISADYSQHHIIDPRTGSSPTELASATVIAPTALDADALGTALMVMGGQAGLALAERLPGVEAVLVTKDLRVLKTSGAA